MSHSFAEQLKQHRETILSERGVLIAYKQRGIYLVNIPAVPATSDYLNEKSSEYRTKHIDRAYTVEFGLLNWNGKQIIPMSGDNIIEGETVYEVVPIEQKQCYRPIDPDGTYMRIFVKQITKTVSSVLPPPGGCTHRPMTEQEVTDLVNNAFQD